MEETLHSFALYLRIILYLFLGYSLYSVAIIRWTSQEKEKAVIHFTMAGIFSIGALVLIVPRVVPGIPDFAAIVNNVMDFVVTPLLLMITVYVWRVVVKQEREQVKKAEQKMNGRRDTVPIPK